MGERSTLNAQLSVQRHADFFDLTPIESQLIGYNTCFFCLGVSSVGMNNEDYKHITYDLTMHVAALLAKQNPDLTFCYVTGTGTDRTVKGRIACARIKGATENTLMKVFKRSDVFRCAFMKASPGQKNLKLAMTRPRKQILDVKNIVALANVSG